MKEPNPGRAQKMSYLISRIGAIKGMLHRVFGRTLIKFPCLRVRGGANWTWLAPESLRLADRLDSVGSSLELTVQSYWCRKVFYLWVEVVWKRFVTGKEGGWWYRVQVKWGGCDGCRMGTLCVYVCV